MRCQIMRSIIITDCIMVAGKSTFEIPPFKGGFKKLLQTKKRVTDMIMYRAGSSDHFDIIYVTVAEFLKQWKLPDYYEYYKSSELRLLSCDFGSQVSRGVLFITQIYIPLQAVLKPFAACVSLCTITTPPPLLPHTYQVPIWCTIV